MALRRQSRCMSLADGIGATLVDGVPPLAISATRHFPAALICPLVSALYAVAVATLCSAPTDYGVLHVASGAAVWS